MSSQVSVTHPLPLPAVPFKVSAASSNYLPGGANGGLTLGLNLQGGSGGFPVVLLDLHSKNQTG